MVGLIEAIVKIHFPQKGKEEMQVRTSVWGGVAGGSSWVYDSMSWTQLYAQAMLPSVVSLGSTFSRFTAETALTDCPRPGPQRYSVLHLLSVGSDQEWLSQHFDTTIKFYP